MKCLYSVLGTRKRSVRLPCAASLAAKSRCMSDVDPAAASVAGICAFLTMLLRCQLRVVQRTECCGRRLKAPDATGVTAICWWFAEQAEQTDQCWPLTKSAADVMPYGVGCSKVALDTPPIHTHTHTRARSRLVIVAV